MLEAEEQRFFIDPSTGSSFVGGLFQDFTERYSRAGWFLSLVSDGVWWSKATRPRCGRCLPLTIGIVQINANFLVAKETDQAVLMGMPFLNSAGWELRVGEEGDRWMMVRSEQ